MKRFEVTTKDITRTIHADYYEIVTGTTTYNFYRNFKSNPVATIERVKTIEVTTPQIPWSIKFFLVALACIFIGIALWSQVVTQFGINPVVVAVVFFISIVLLALIGYSIRRAVKGD